MDVENMSSAELQAHLASAQDKAKAVKAPKAKPAVKAPKAKPAAKSKPKSKAKAVKAPKAKRVSKVAAIGQHLIENKGKEFKSTDLAKLFKSRGVEVHRAVSRLERMGATITATRSGPTQKPGRRAFLYSLTKGPAKVSAKS